MNRIATALLLGLATTAGTSLLPQEAASQGTAAFRVPVRHEGNIEFPQVSPDGKQVAYEVNYPADKRRELFIVDVDGRKAGTPVKLVPESMASNSRYGVGNRVTHGFSWAHTGSYAYAYGVSDQTGAQNIYIDNWSELISSGESANKNPAWDPTEARFIFSSGRTGNGDLYLWDKAEPMQMTFDEKDAELYPVWSPKGGKVAYVRQGKAGSHVFILDVAAFTTEPIVQFSGSESTRPSFSPDGNRLAFFSNRGSESPTQFSLWVTDARQGGNPRKIGDRVVLPSKGAASWTPDGKAVVAVMDDPDKGDPLCIFPVDGGSPRCPSTGTRNNRDPVLKLIEGQWRILFTAQTGVGDADSTWQELYAFDVPR